MLLTRSLPPQVLLSAWGTRTLYRAVQRAYSSDEGDKTKRSHRPTKRTVSLFDQLFPPERTKEDDEGESKAKLPPFEFNVLKGREVQEEERKDTPRWTIGRQKHSFQEEEQVTSPSQERWGMHEGRASAVLLNCASKTLEESDFFRVSPRGEHIEGWTRSIITVIQDRDANTLEPLGVYYIFFSSEAAALAYLDQIIHLHDLARANSGTLRSATLPPPPGLLRPGEDMREALKTFSLIPGQSKLNIRLAAQPLNPVFVEMLKNGGRLPSMAKFQRMGEGMVMFTVDAGHIRAFELLAAIQQDGKRRNLHWALADNGISALASNQPDDVREELFGDGDSEIEKEAVRKEFRLPSRYVLSFKDRYEARRFVREWHRRPFPINMEISPGDETQPIVNAEIMW